MKPVWLLAHDLSDESAAILDKIAGELEALKGHLYLLHVYNFPSPPTSFGMVGSETTFATAQEFSTALSERADKQLAKIKNALKKKFPKLKLSVIIREGNAVEEIIGVCKEKQIDRLVVGTHGRRGVGRILMGSVAERVVRLAPVSVLVVKTQAQDDGNDS